MIHYVTPKESALTNEKEPSLFSIAGCSTTAG